jgi:GNAT superfamily N-acetyltransferase
MGSIGNAKLMKPLLAWEEVLELVAQARNEGLGVTNFFPDEVRMSAWCRDGVFYGVRHGDTQFFVRRQPTFSNVYFVSRSAGALGEDWKTFALENGNGKWIVDLIGPDRVRQPLEDTMSSVGFSRLTTLQRMGRKTPEDVAEFSSDMEHATLDDAEKIKELLDAHFIAEEEQIPSLEEIRKWIGIQGLFVMRGGAVNSIDGFVIFDLSPAALYLRYWFVHPSARGKGIGGRLLKAMFAAGRTTKRQYFWVKTDNENAIKRYRHYGFQFEPMKDVVMAYADVL